MTTTQLTKLKDAGFTLEQIIAIGEIFDPPQKPDRPAAEKPKPDLMEEVRKAYERGKKEAEERQRQKEMGPLIRADGWRYEPGPTCQGDGFLQKFRDTRAKYEEMEQRAQAIVSSYVGFLTSPAWITADNPFGCASK